MIFLDFIVLYMNIRGGNSEELELFCRQRLENVGAKEKKWHFAILRGLGNKKTIPWVPWAISRNKFVVKCTKSYENRFNTVQFS